ncbi:MAG: diacylglycerol kinase family protein, partial [Planctomycetota bacterium]|nr:diacylglycerol kinase family protein [Planctomycetota bacterium]
EVDALISEQGPEQAADFARRAADAQVDRLVLIGGDGTLGFVLNAVPEPPPLLLLPLGTANLLAHHLRWPRDPLACARLAAEGTVVRADCARLRLHDEHGAPIERWSFLCCGFGPDGEIVRRIQEMRSGPIHMHDYAGALAGVATSWSAPIQRVSADGASLGEHRYGISSGISVYGTGWWNLGPCAIDDGRWELYLMPDLTLATAARLATTATWSTLAEARGVEWRAVNTLRVEGDARSPVQADGDFIGWTPLELQLGLRQFRIVAPL